jgi:segregation and condensation protein B
MTDMVQQAELIDTGELDRSIEAVLFVASESLSIDRLAKLTGSSHVEVAEALARIAERYAQRGIVLREIAGGYRFGSSPAARHIVEAYLLPPKTSLSPAAMETLAIVGYLQPVTKAEIEAIRGVNVDSVVSTLLDRRFIAEAGRRDVVGRPIIYKTTPEFLESFGLRSIAELPPVDIDAETREIPLPMANGESAQAESAQPQTGTEGSPVPVDLLVAPDLPEVAETPAETAEGAGS